MQSLLIIAKTKTNVNHSFKNDFADTLRMFKTFVLPASGSDSAEKQLNDFLLSHTIVCTVKNYDAEMKAWCFLVEYADTGAQKPGQKAKIDYMQVLTKEEFAVFSKLREWRKKEAAKEKIPPYVIFTDEQLAQIVKQNPGDAGQIGAISGIGQSKIEKYGNAVIQITKAQVIQNEEGEFSF